MKINNNYVNPNFNAVRYTPNSHIYASTYLSARDKELLKNAVEKLKNTVFWDLEITGGGLRVASKKTKDAFIDEFIAVYSDSENLRIESIYDGYSNSCPTGEKCYFDIKYRSRGYATIAYEEFLKLSTVDKAIHIVEKLEEQAKVGLNSTDPEGSIAKRKNFIGRMFDKLLKL